MPDLSIFSYEVIYNLISLTIATMGAATVFLFLAPGVAAKHRLECVLAGIVTLIAFYHYYQIFHDFEGAFVLSGAMYAYQDGAPFNNYYRYADWLLTVPLLMIELVVAMSLAKGKGRNLAITLASLAAAMILLGYPGQAAIAAVQDGRSESLGPVWIWWIASMIPFLAITGILLARVPGMIKDKPDNVRKLIKGGIGLTVVVWFFYPVAYLVDAYAGTSQGGAVFTQVGYTIADITAKAGLGVVIYFIAKAKTEHELATSGAPAGAAPAVAG